MADQPSPAEIKTGSIRAKINFFEQSDENKKESKHPTTKLKRSATIHHVKLDRVDVCNGDRTAQRADGNVNGQCKQQTARFLLNNCEEDYEKFRLKNDGDLKRYSYQAKSGQNATVFTFSEGSERNETELYQTKTKPKVPIKKVTNQQTNTAVPFSTNNTNDSNIVTETCKPGNVCDTARNRGMAENSFVRQNKFVYPQNSSAMSESSLKKPHTTQDREELQMGHKVLARSKTILVRAPVPRSNQSDCTSSNHRYTVLQPQYDTFDDALSTTDEEEQCTSDRLISAGRRGSFHSATVRTGASLSASSVIRNQSYYDKRKSMYVVIGTRFDSALVPQASTDGLIQHAELCGGESLLTAGSQQDSGFIKIRFADEPLYQFYIVAVVERDMQIEGPFDICVEIDDLSCKPKQRRSVKELIEPRERKRGTLWCEIPEVSNSGILNTISKHQLKLQEAKFEIITSEVSYFNSLKILEEHFMSNLLKCDESVLSQSNRRLLFSNLIPVKTCSEQFLAELEKCWQNNILLKGICEIVYKHASNNFNGYIKYCSNQKFQGRKLRELKEHNKTFAAILQKLETKPVCQSLALHSFLTLPMQRITRLPRLIEAVLTHLDQTHDEYSTCQLALATLNSIVLNCNEEARKMERAEEMLILSRQFYFPNEVKTFPISSSTRWLVRKGELTHLVWGGKDGKRTLQKKNRPQIHLFLFTDLLVIAKKKRKPAPGATGGESYKVMDYCPRNLVQMTSIKANIYLPRKVTSDDGQYQVLLTMKHNHQKKTVKMNLSCSTESDRQRWLEAVSPPVLDDPDKRVYDERDCPQVMAVYRYVAYQPDELSLEVSDVLKVLRKMSDGWYEGERIRDGESGWFPGNYTIEVESADVRARNIKQHCKLLALEAQQKLKKAN